MGFSRLNIQRLKNQIKEMEKREAASSTTNNGQHAENEINDTESSKTGLEKVMFYYIVHFYIPRLH